VIAIDVTAVNLTDVIRRRETLSLLFSSVLLAGCGSETAAKPDLPASVSPGWRQDSFAPAAKPADIPGSPECWKANYSGQGTAEVLVCGYKEAGGAFDAAQRARAEAQEVKFQSGRYFVLVKWNNAPKVGITALVRAIQKSLNPKA
jgi:hypothetical protein